MPHKTKMPKNKLRADQNKTRTCMEHGQNMPRNGPKTKDIQSHKGDTLLQPPQPLMAWTRQPKTEFQYIKMHPKTH